MTEIVFVADLGFTCFLELVRAYAYWCLTRQKGMDKGQVEVERKVPERATGLDPQLLIMYRKCLARKEVLLEGQERYAALQVLYVRDMLACKVLSRTH